MRKTRMKDPETGQWIKIFPGDPLPGEEKAKAKPDNKARPAAPENKGQ